MPFRYLLLTLSALSAPALAQDFVTPSAAEDADSAERHSGEILVVATRLHGQVEAAQPPIITLDEAEIAAYGASSLTDLVAALSPQTGSGRGRGSGGPVILVNGQRVGSFREMRNYPPEAIRRVEVLPEEVALRFGYAANQRVVNFILKDNFVSRSIEADYGQPGAGGFSSSEQEISFLRINGPRRLNVTLKADDTTLLTEAERGVIQADPAAPLVAGDPDPAEFRSLVADSRELTLNASWSVGLGEGGTDGQFGLNGTVTRNDSRSLSGLDAVVLTDPDGASALRTLAGPLERRNRITSLQGGASLAKPLGDWQLSATLDASHVNADTVIDRRADTSALVATAAAGTLAIDAPLPALISAGVDLAETTSDSVSSLVTLIGRPLRLPAGEVTTTFKTGYSFTGISSRDTRGSGAAVRLERGDLSGGINVGIPLTSVREDALGAIGDITLNFSAGINLLSDFGTLTDWSAGVTWAPTEKLSLQASYLVNQAAPSLANLGNPQVVSFNVPVYDFTRGETVLATLTGGGNPLLQRETQRDLKLSASWNFLMAEYFRNSSRNVTADFPLLTPAIEAAFPGRVTRDPTGQLLAVDLRPITLARQDSSRLRYGVNFSGTIGKPPAGGRSAPGAGGPPRGPGGPRAGGGRGPGGMMGMMGGGQGRWNISLYHTIRFSDVVQIAPGGPVLDLLDGDALSGGGTARHSLELETGAFHKGFGLRLAGNFTAPTTVRASGVPGSSDLRFGSIARLDLRLFSDLGQQKALTAFSPFFKGARLALRVDNLLNTRQRVTDASGTVPLSYQPDYLNPRGRFFEIELRKMF